MDKETRKLINRLKTENKTLRAENAELKSNIHKFGRPTDKEIFDSHKPHIPPPPPEPAPIKVEVTVKREGEISPKPDNLPFDPEDDESE